MISLIQLKQSFNSIKYLFFIFVSVHNWFIFIELFITWTLIEESFKLQVKTYKKVDWIEKMPTDAVWVFITVPRKDYEKQLKTLKRQNFKNNLNISGKSQILYQNYRCFHHSFYFRLINDKIIITYQLINKNFSMNRRLYNIYEK